MERPAWAPRNIDISVPSVSRIYDYYLGGSHNFEVDREAARKAMEFLPGLPRIMRANRAFLRRAVRYAVAEGVTQFLDIGSGIPTHGNVHEVAQEAHPGARVVYVDHDPVAVAHSQAVLGRNPDADVVAADLLKPRDILASPELGRLIDLNRPVALLLVAILHFVEDANDPYRAVAELRDALAPGSLLVLTHASYEGIPLPHGAGRGRGRRVQGHPQSADHALARGDRAVLRGVRHGGTRAGADGGLAARHGARGRGSLRLRGLRRMRGARRERGAGRAGGQTAPVRDDLEPGRLPGGHDAAHPARVRGPAAAAGPAAERGAAGARVRRRGGQGGGRRPHRHLLHRPRGAQRHARLRRRLPGALLRRRGHPRRRPAAPGRPADAAAPALAGGAAHPLRPPPARDGRRVRPGAARAHPRRAGGDLRRRAQGPGRRRRGPARERGPLPRRLRGRGDRHLHRRPRRQRPGGQRRAAAHVRRLRGAAARPQRRRVVAPRGRPAGVAALPGAGARRTRALPRGEAVLPARRHRPVDQSDGVPAAGPRRRAPVPARADGGHHRAPAAQPAAALRGHARRAHRTAQPHPVLRAA